MAGSTFFSSRVVAVRVLIYRNEQVLVGRVYHLILILSICERHLLIGDLITLVEGDTCAIEVRLVVFIWHPEHAVICNLQVHLLLPSIRPTWVFVAPLTVVALFTPRIPHFCNFMHYFSTLFGLGYIEERVGVTRCQTIDVSKLTATCNLWILHLSPMSVDFLKLV